MNDEDWKCHGWEDHEIFFLETGQRMSFRAKLKWLEEADRMVRFLARKRRWIDKDGVIHEAGPMRVAEPPAEYRASSGANPSK